MFFNMAWWDFLSKEDSGLPVDVHLDGYHLYDFYKWSKRLIFAADKNANSRDSFVAFMTISDEPKVLGEHELSELEIQQIKDFVIKNKELLERLSVMDKEIDIIGFMERMIKV